ncbi:MAG: thiol reductant ABC exporter subunit CydD [Actinomycetes bacterium]
MRPLDPRLLTYAKSARTYLALSVLNGTVTAGLVIGQASLLGGLLAGIFTGSRSTQDITTPLVWLTVIVVARAITSWFSDVAAARTSARAKHELRTAVLTHVRDLGPAWINAQRSSNLATSVMRGLDGLDPYFARYLPQLVLAAIVPLAVGAWILTNDMLSAIIVAVTVPLVPFFMVLIGRFTKTAQEKQWSTLQTLSGHFLDLISGLTTLKAFNRSKSQRAGLLRVGEEYRTTTMGVLRISFLSSLVLELISTLSIALVAVSIGLRLVTGDMHLEQGLVILILVPEVYLPLRALGAQFHAMAEGIEAAEHVFSILETPMSKTKYVTVQTPKPSGFNPPPAAIEPLRVSHIEFQDVSYRYPEMSTHAVSNFTAEFTAGQISVITGPSGVGKTTALNVLLRFITDFHGDVQFDGKSVREINPEVFRASIGYLPQKPWIGHSTIREALTVSRPALDTELNSVGNAVGLDFANRTDFPCGLDTVVTSSSGLSGGQRRRLALARILLRNSPIVILDEPTASLDGETEDIITHTLQTLAHNGALVIAVAHRPSLIAVADHVVVMGTHVRQDQS